MRRRRILFVHGLEPNCRARDVAYEFERYGRIVRCDIPAQRVGESRSGYAFVEFDDARDAEDAYRHLHGRRFVGGVLKIQWAKRPPKAWRRDDGYHRRGDSGRSRSRSRSPGSDRDRRRSGRSRSPEGGDRQHGEGNWEESRVKSSGQSSQSPMEDRQVTSTDADVKVENGTTASTNNDDFQPMSVKA